MVAINFTLDGTHGMLESRQKRTTIRGMNIERLVQIVDRGNIEAYWHQRQKDCYKMADCRFVHADIIRDLEDWLYNTATEMDAWLDGFPYVEKMTDWFEEHQKTVKVPAMRIWYAVQEMHYPDQINECVNISTSVVLNEPLSRYQLTHNSALARIKARTVGDKTPLCGSCGNYPCDQATRDSCMKSQAEGLYIYG